MLHASHGMVFFGWCLVLSTNQGMPVVIRQCDIWDTRLSKLLCKDEGKTLQVQVLACVQ